MAPRVTLARPPKGKLDKGGTAGPGRGKGTPNKTTRILREAIILAAEQVGEDKKGTGELVGYLKWIAKTYPDLFCTLLGRVLPMQLIGPGMGESPIKVELTLPQLQERLKERGLPIGGTFDKPIQLLPPPPTTIKVTNGANGHSA